MRRGNSARPTRRGPTHSWPLSALARRVDASAWRAPESRVQAAPDAAALKSAHRPRRHRALRHNSDELPHHRRTGEPSPEHKSRATLPGHSVRSTRAICDGRPRAFWASQPPQLARCRAHRSDCMPVQASHPPRLARCRTHRLECTSLEASQPLGLLVAERTVSTARL